MKKIIILGNSGSVGRPLFSYFQAKKDVAVIGYSSKTLDLRNPSNYRVLDKVVDRNTAFLIVSGVTLDRQGDSLDNFIANSEIALGVARYLEKHPVAVCVYFSTVSVYGDTTTNLSINEKTQINPTMHYSAAKFSGECILKNVASLFGFEFLCVRLCRVYGPGTRDANYGPVRFIRSIRERGAIELYGDGKESREFLYIDDLCRLVEGLIKGGYSGIYNLATGVNHTFMEVALKLKTVAKQEFKISFLPRTRPLIDQRFDITKLLKALPSFCFTSLEDGLKATYEYEIRQADSPTKRSSHLI